MLKKPSRHPKNSWIEPTPPTHSLPNFFLGGGKPISSKILIFFFPNFLSKMAWSHPPTHFKIVFECLDFLTLQHP